MNGMDENEDWEKFLSETDEMSCGTTDVDPSTEVDYDDTEHKYFLSSWLYRSATQIVEKFINPFNPLETAERMVYRYGMTVEYWLKKWKVHNRISLVRGNRQHNYQEQFLYDRGFDHINGKQFQVFDRRKVKKIKGLGYETLFDGVYPELKLWRHDWRIAGRVDKPTIETISTKRYFHVDDYKTGARIDTEGFRGQTMLYPLDHLQDCETSHYSLQLSLYGYMAEYFSYSPGQRRLIHFPHEIEGLGTPSPRIIELPYLRDEVISMLTHLKQTGWLQ